MRPAPLPNSERLTRQKVAYRNYYTASNDPDWEDLVAGGYATKRPSPVSADTIYHLTKQAAFYFLNEGERLGDDMRFPPDARALAEKQTGAK
jgi:hypothetical protein